MDIATLDTLEKEMLSKSIYYWVENPLNQKQSASDNVYRLSKKGFVPYKAYRDNALRILSTYEINNSAEQDRYIRELSRRRKIRYINRNSTHYLATQNGTVIDFKALLKIVLNEKADVDIEQFAEKWRRPINAYIENRITMNTGVDYPQDGNWQEGEKALEAFLRMSLYSKDEETFQNTKTWLFDYLGRLLIGGNTRKEFVVFVGEKDSGKTTFVTLLSEILGTYAGMIQDEVLMGKDSDQLHRMLYELKDKRLLLHSEGTNRRSINTQTLKRITGGSEYSLRDDVSFVIKGKIMEDTNYIPFPDNENDAAFNDRIIIIPFIRNTALPRERIAEIVKQLNACKASIFAFMVRMTCRSIFKEPEKPTCSIEVKRQLDIIRNPVKQFYNQVVDNDVPDHTNTLGTALYRCYLTWMTDWLKPNMERTPYLKSETCKLLSETNFFSQIQNIHKGGSHISSRGRVFTRMYMNETNIYKNDGNWPNLPPTIMSSVYKSAAQQIEQTIKLVKVVDSPQHYENEMEKTRDKAERKLNNILQEKPELKEKTMLTMAMMNPIGPMGPYGMPPPNMGMGMGMFQNMGMGMGMPPNMSMGMGMGTGMPFIPFPPPDVMYQYRINYLYNQLMAQNYTIMMLQDQLFSQMSKKPVFNKKDAEDKPEEEKQ